MALIKMRRRLPASPRNPVPSLGFGCAFLDIDLDGRLDLVAVQRAYR